MIEHLPTWIEILFVLCVFFTMAVFYYTNQKPRTATLWIIIWSVAQSLLAYTGFYKDTESLPPRFLLVIVPVVILVIINVRKGLKERTYESRNLGTTTLLHLIRIPVEIVLYYLFMAGAVPELMTFAGRNFDILAGLTAPIVSWLIYSNRISKQMLIGWNLCSLFLLLFIIVNAILSVQSPLQQFGFDQPNIAISYFPFVLLPATVVPLVIYTHIMDIVKLIKE